METLTESTAARYLDGCDRNVQCIELYFLICFRCTLYFSCVDVSPTSVLARPSQHLLYESFRDSLPVDMWHCIVFGQIEAACVSAHKTHVQGEIYRVTACGWCEVTSCDTVNK